MPSKGGSHIGWGRDSREQVIEWMAGIPHIGREDAEVLYANGLDSKKAVLVADVLELASIKGIGFKRGKEIKQGIISYIGQNREECERLKLDTEQHSGQDWTGPKPSVTSTTPTPEMDESPSQASDTEKTGGFSKMFKKVSLFSKKEEGEGNGE